MYVDAFTIAALVDEFMDTLVGGRVQDSVVVDSTGIGLEIYANHKRHYLYLSADKHTPRVHVVDQKLRRGLPKPPQLALLVRRYVEGGVITHVSQPPYERIMHIDIESTEGEFTLIVEPMARRSNLILVRDGMILDCAQRVGPDDNRYRITLPAHEYVPPPPMTDKIDPAKLTLEAVRGIFEQNGDPKAKTARLLGGRILGFNQLLGKEVVHLAGASVDQKAVDADVDAIYAALVAFVAPLLNREWQAGVVETEDSIEAFSVYPIMHMDGWRPVESISEAMTLYFGMPSGPDGYKVAKKPVEEAIREALIKERAKLASLESGLRDDSQMEQLRQSGELILAYQYTMKPKQTELRAQYDVEGDELVIRLDPSLSALENAQAYFKKYEKAKRARDDVPQLIEETQNRIDYLTQLEADIDMASNWVEIDEVRQILRGMNYWQGKAPQKIGGSGKTAPMRLVNRDGFVVWVGRNSRQNDLVTFGKGGGDDLWLHARDVPGSHVVIKYDGRKIPERLIEQAAAIAAYYSKRREESAVIVDVTQCKHVRKIKGAAPGMVTYRNEETRTVVPQPETILDEDD